MKCECGKELTEANQSIKFGLCVDCVNNISKFTGIYVDTNGSDVIGMKEDKDPITSEWLRERFRNINDELRDDCGKFPVMTHHFKVSACMYQNVAIMEALCELLDRVGGNI